MARPTKYNDEVLEKAREYIENHEQYDDLVPSVEGLAYHIKVSKNSLYAWAEENEEFLTTLEAVKTKQAKMLLSGGLSGDYNASIAKLMLYNHGYSEKQETKHSGGITFVAGESEIGRV